MMQVLTELEEEGRPTMTNRTETAFADLLDAWTEHQDLRSQHATVTELFASRARLDSARLAARRAA